MNETTPPPGDPAGTTPGEEGRPPSSDRFFSWLRGLGIVRGSDRWFAGVAGGIAAKAGIDPLIVRGIFVVLAILGGPGILLYLAGWLLLPDASGRIHLEEVLRGRASAGVIVTVVILGALILIPILFGALPGLFFGGFWNWDLWGFAPDWIRITFTVIWWALIVPGLIVWLIVWLSRGGLSGRGRATGVGDSSPGASGAPAPAAGPAGAGSASFVAGSSGPAEAAAPRSFADQARSGADQAHVTGEQVGQRANEWGEEFGRKTEEWGRKVEEKSREWERKGTEYYEAHRLGAGHVVITLACALLAAGGTAAWALTRTADGGMILTAGLIAAVAVLGVSMIVAGIRGRHTGWIGFLSFVGVIALLFSPFTAVFPKDTQVVPFGNVNTVVKSGGSDQAVLTIAGNSTVDLGALGPAGDARVVDLWVLAGNVTVRLPEDHPTRVQVNLLAGNVRDFRLDADERRQGGIFMSRSVESGTHGFDASEVTQVRVRLLAGNVNIEGGTTSTSSPTADDRSSSEDITRIEEQIADLERQLQNEQKTREQTQEHLEDLRNELENAR